MEVAAIFFGQLAAVFLLGFQSRCVNTGQAGIGFCTSVCIGMCQLYMFKKIPDAAGLEAAAFLLGGPIGIVASIYIHKHFWR